MNGQRTSNSLYIPKVNSPAFGANLYRGAIMNAMVVHQSFNEQRKYPRFKPDTKIFILHSYLGTVRDIGIGGLSYTYYHWPEESSNPLPKVGTIFSAGKHHLNDIPFTVVADTVVRESYSFFPELKQRRICFSGLTEKQLQRLEQFVLAHAVVPKSSVEYKIPPTVMGKFNYTL